MPMKVRLHDNAREAFQFLAMGAGIVLAARLLVAAFGLWSGGSGNDDLAAAIVPFRNGYPLVERHTLVVGGPGDVARIAVGALFTLAMGAAMVVIAILFGTVLKLGALRSAVMGGRAGLLIGGAWAIYCLLCLPPHRVEVTAQGLVRRDSPAFLGEIPWPLAGQRHEHPWGSVSGIEHRLLNSSMHTCRDVVVTAHTAEGSFPIASLFHDRGDCATLTAQRERDALRLIEVLDSLRMHGQ